MGVTGTFCQICGMPVQHDCYIPVKDSVFGDMYYIYRGPNDPTPLIDADDNQVTPEFGFKPEHDWLIDAVALRLDESEQPQIVEGEIHDGSVEIGNEDVNGCFVWDGFDDRAALHRACWELSGQKEYEEIADIINSSSWQALSEYHQQLFDFTALERDGKAWMLADPNSNSPDGQRNRERILSMLEENDL